MTYVRRILDDELDELLGGLAAVAIEGPKAVGKTATALQRAQTVHRLDDDGERQIAQADPARLATGKEPVLIDEWQRLPESWDVVRRAVDEDPSPNRFLLTGSASPADPPTHSVAGRIVRVRMRPLSLAERAITRPTVSLAELLAGTRPTLSGASDVALRRYAEEIVTSGFPAIRSLRGRALRAQLESYVNRVVDRDFPEAGQPVRNPEMLVRWMRAYAAATATTATLETIRDAATSGEQSKPSRPVVLNYRSVLQRLWLRQQIGGDLLDAAVLHTGPEAYRRPDGIAVIPAALLGP